MKEGTTLTKGEIINNTYEVRFFIDQGAFGETYRVKHRFFEEYQVMKVFKENYVEKTDLNEVINEGRILIRLNHKNVVKVFEINTFIKNNKDRYFITMSFVSGESLAKLLLRKTWGLDVPAATSIMTDVLKGLSAAHNNDPTIVHRDISPDNILLSYDEFPPPIGVLGDFGIAIIIDKKHKLADAGGRYIYFAPECFMNVFQTTSDVFSIGVVFYKMLTGMHPWAYNQSDYNLNDYGEVATMINIGRRETPKKPSLFNNDIDKKLEKVIMKSIEKKMENRFKTAGSFLNALEDACKMEDLEHNYWLDQDLISTT